MYYLLWRMKYNVLLEPGGEEALALLDQISFIHVFPEERTRNNQVSNRVKF
jgi:hypothetical protein